MADLSKLRFNGTDYNVKDASAPTRKFNNAYSKTGNLPISSDDTTQTAIGKLENNIIPKSAKGTANGVAELDANGKVPSSQLPSYVDDVLEYSAKSSFPATGESGKIYVDTTTNKTYRWSGSAYVEISESLALGETDSTAYRGDRGKAAYDHSQLTSGNPHNVTKSDVGLGNVGNFKAVSTAASQGLSDTEKSNARANIGAGTGNGTYSKPSGGIPKSDLASAVQTTLDQVATNQTNILYRIKTIKIGSDSTEYNPDTETGIATIPAYPTTLPASDVSAWAKAANKPTYTASEVGAIATTAKGANSGVAELDANGKVPSSQLPSYVDDVLEYSAKSSFPATGETGKIYVDTTTNLTYRWSGTAYVEISPSLALGDTSSTAYRGDRGKTAYNHATDSSRLKTATASGLYKVASTNQGHIASLTAVTKSDITGLGIPASDTNTYVSGASFADNTSSDANNPLKLTLARSGSVTTSVTGTLPKVSSSTAGVVPKGASVSSQSQTTKFLREDGSWAVPSYTTNTNTTYTLATGDSNGQIKVTPSSGSAYNVSVKGLGSAAYASNATGINLSNYSTPAKGTSTTIGASDAIQTAVGKLDRQNYDLTYLQAEDRAELVELVDSGAKNLCTNSSITSLIVDGFSDVSWFSEPIPAGTYVLRAKITSAKASQIMLVNTSNIELAIVTPAAPSGTNADYISNPFTITEKAYGFRIYSNASPTTWSDIMICTKAAFGVSQKFVPYRYDPYTKVVQNVKNTTLYAKRNGRTVTVNGYVDNISFTAGSSTTLGTINDEIGKPLQQVRAICSVGVNAYTFGESSYIAIAPDGNIVVTPKTYTGTGAVFFSVSYTI